eukprot:TRINITY_DN67553_c10_g1_i1.p1 TRINITY_DN67553_c10_g1~~TRINITY_DN67553_c10_g1_i1.p1  ORF type:complete len:274 (+),score=4.01 TRINITY_DN67553_c10_g1_i1:142-963(+)
MEQTKSKVQHAANEDEDITACTLFAGDLSSVCTETHLFELFSPFGEIDQIRIQKSKKNVSLGYAFVTMKDPASAFNAMTSLNGLLLYGRKLRLGYAQHHAKIDSESIMKTRINSLYFRFTCINGITTKEEVENIFNMLESGETTPSDYPDFEENPEDGIIIGLVTEEIIREIFSPCGQINDVSIRRIVAEKGVKRGYGFIHFNDINGVISALENMKQVFKDQTLFVLEPSKNLQQQLTAIENGELDPSNIENVIITNNETENNTEKKKEKKKK